MATKYDTYAGNISYIYYPQTLGLLPPVIHTQLYSIAYTLWMDQQSNDHLLHLFNSRHYSRDQQLVQPIVGWFSNGFNLHILTVRPDQLNKLLHRFASSSFWANRRKKIKLGGAYVYIHVVEWFLYFILIPWS